MDNLLLKNIVNRHFKVDLDNNSKDPVIFTARSVYSGIAKSYSLRVTEIGRSMNKSHSCVARYLKNADYRLNNDPEFTKKYNDCLKEYKNDIPADSSERSLNSELSEQNNKLQNTNRGLRTKVAYLNTVVNELEKHLNSIKLKGVYGDIDRFRDIIDLLKERVDEGQEKDAYNRILRTLNSRGLKFYNTHTDTFRSW